MTLAEWEVSADAAGRREITICGQGIPGPNFREYMRGIYDSPSIEHVRSWLFGLSDYTVRAVSGGVIWLIPGESAPHRWRRESGA